MGNTKLEGTGVSVTDKRVFDSGAVRDDRTGKGRFDLISPHALLALAKRLEEGAVHYGDRNWEKGMNVSACYDSCLRHLQQFWMGDTSEDHLAAALCNVMFMLHTVKENPDFDDRPKFNQGYEDGRSA